MEYQSEEYQNIADREKSMRCHQTAVMPDGLWPVMLTPFTEEKEVDYQGLKALTRWYLEQGAAGLFAVCLSNENNALKSGKPVFMRLSGLFLCAVTLL